MCTFVCPYVSWWRGTVGALLGAQMVQRPATAALTMATFSHGTPSFLDPTPPVRAWIDSLRPPPPPPLWLQGRSPGPSQHWNKRQSAAHCLVGRPLFSSFFSSPFPLISPLFLIQMPPVAQRPPERSLIHLLTK